MADMIKCPVCGENNRLGQEFCLNCQTRLGPVPGSSKGDETLKPGQAPTKKNTADLEPILPQWLKDARDSARNIGSGDVPAEPSTPKQTQPASPVDFLAGLPIEEARSWLTKFNGVGPKTAAIVLCFSLNMPAFPVDTHVYRVTGRIGLRPEKMTVEQAHPHLESVLPPETYYAAHLNIIRLGREICHARKPNCPQCPIVKLCEYKEKTK